MARHLWIEFEETLAGTAKKGLRSLRDVAQRSGNWSLYLSVVSVAKPVALVRGGTSLDLLDVASREFESITVISNSPTDVPRRWLRERGWEVDHVVGTVRKPDARGLRRLATDRGYGASEVLLIDAGHDGVSAGRELGVDEVATVRRRTFRSATHARLITNPSEVTSGGFALYGERMGSDAAIVEFDNGGFQSFALGRVDRSLGDHQWSASVLALKDGRPSGLVSDALSSVLDNLIADGVLPSDHVIAPIPPRSGERPRLASVLGLSEGPLRWSRKTWKQRGTHGGKRWENVRGAIGAEGVAGRHVVVIDDVVTTGSTLLAAGEGCRAARASAVTLLAVGAWQNLAYRDPAKFRLSKSQLSPPTLAQGSASGIASTEGQLANHGKPWTAHHESLAAVLWDAGVRDVDVYTELLGRTPHAVVHRISIMRGIEIWKVYGELGVYGTG